MAQWRASKDDGDDNFGDLETRCVFENVKKKRNLLGRPFGGLDHVLGYHLATPCW